MISLKVATGVPITVPVAAAFPLDEIAQQPVVCRCGLTHDPGCCPDDYRRELEPRDETIAELQSVVVAMRHRGDTVDDLAADIELIAWQLLHVARLPNPVAPPRGLQLIRLSMALAAVAVRYREEL
jgi:hypothetical protein